MVIASWGPFIHHTQATPADWTFHNEGRFPPRLFFELDSTSANGSMEGASPTTIHYNYMSVTHTVISNPRGSGFSGHQQYQDDNDVAISNPRIPKVSGHSNGPNTSENLWRRLMMHVLVQNPSSSEMVKASPVPHSSVLLRLGWSKDRGKCSPNRDIHEKNDHKSRP